MAWTTTVPAAINALLNGLLGSAELTDVQIVDGPALSGSSRQQVITIGYTDEESPGVVEATSELQDMTSARSRELYTINNAIIVARGSADIAGARTRVYELYNAVAAVVAADPRLSGTVMQAALGEHSLEQSQNQKAAVSKILFGVNCDAFSGR